jgi:hypothetical protein
VAALTVTNQAVQDTVAQVLAVFATLHESIKTLYESTKRALFPMCGVDVVISDVCVCCI